ITGGASDDTLTLTRGANGIVLDATHIQSIETLTFADNASYQNVAIHGDITSGGGTLHVDASALSNGHSVSLDLSGATTQTVDFTGGAGDDTVTVNASALGTVDGGHNGALDQNVLVLAGGTTGLTLVGDTGDDSVTPTVSNIEKLMFADGASYTVT